MSESLTDEVILLRGQVDFLLEHREDQRGAGGDRGPVNWSALDTEQAAEQWARLTGWVDWLRHRYQLHEVVPACWYAHPPQLEELSALRASWVAAYTAPDAQPADGSAWHDLLDRGLRRLRQWDRTGCADGTHRPDHSPPDDTDHHDHRETHIQHDLDRRDTPTQENP